MCTQGKVEDRGVFLASSSVRGHAAAGKEPAFGLRQMWVRMVTLPLWFCGLQ